jgi:protoporphyrinogen oxidase
VIGAGVAGLVCAHRIGREGHGTDVYERWPGLGGQAATIDIGGGLRLERYYHHLFTSDRHIAELYAELGMPAELEWRSSSMAFFLEGRSWPFTSPMHLLRFGPLSLPARLRMGLAVLKLQKTAREVGPFEGITAREWIRTSMGEQPYEKVWGPLLRGKFGDRADDISMAWLWGKLTMRRKLEGKEARQELLGYPRRSWEPLFDALRDSIEDYSGRVLIDRPAVRLSRRGEGFELTAGAPGSFRRGHDPRTFEPDGAPERYDAVVATVPNDVFLGLLGDDLAAAIGAEYLGRLARIEYHTALCLLLELDRQFSPYYWTNIADPELPFVGLVEHTNFVEPERYDGRRFLYVANYLAPGDELLDLDAGELLERYTPGLRKVNPEFDRSWVRERWLHREPAAQPIVTVGYREGIPPLQTGVPRLVLANTTQIYPEDRGTNYAVRLGGDAAEALLSRRLKSVWSETGS